MESVNNDMVVRALNYHGQQLTNFMKDQPVFRHLDLKGVDYHLYLSRSKELRMEDRGRRLMLHKFIAQNTETLFRKQEGGSSSGAHAVSCEDVVPPIETFVTKYVSKDDRVRRFYELVDEGDVLYCTIASKNVSGVLLNVLCFAPESGKARVVLDLGIKCFCPAAEMVPAEEGRFYDQESILLSSANLVSML